MDDTERKQITDANEEYVREWFSASGFASKRLDTKGSGKHGKKADWKFTKPNLTVLCEVKTIFSGGQSGLTPEQYERERLETERKYERYSAQAKAEGSLFLVTKDDLDYIQGKTPYPIQKVRKETHFNDFIADVQKQLETDQTINQLPFSVHILLNLSVAEGDERAQFIKWLKDFVLWAHQHHDSEGMDTWLTFSSSQSAKDVITQSGIKASVQVCGPFSDPQLKVDFLTGGGNYHESKLHDDIDEAFAQLSASIAEATTSTVVPIIALWSESDYLRFLPLLIMDVTEAQIGNTPKRYYLIDWAFSDYPEIAAIILFVLPRDKDAAFGFVVTNPNLPDTEKALKAAITENCQFITGIASDPRRTED